ncbi:MAG: 2-oxoglutarate-dependent dioxygenase, partial [Xanthomonadaceae bacterium]|nr:2-oxoglutarate-dependent dioxygenase [Xanthomonadaceae bacterium]
MTARTVISPELREWILATSRAGHAPRTVVELMRSHGYDPRQSRSVVAEVLKLPLATLLADADAPLVRRTRHPEAPLAMAADREVRVSLSVTKPALRVLDGLLTGEECDELVALARPRLARALTVDATGNLQVDHRRTSAGMFFKLGELPLVAQLEQRIAGLLEIPVS